MRLKTGEFTNSPLFHSPINGRHTGQKSADQMREVGSLLRQPLTKRLLLFYRTWDGGEGVKNEEEGPAVDNYCVLSPCRV